MPDHWERRTYVCAVCRTEAFDHAHHGADLRGVARRIGRARVAPPVPAAARVVDPPVARDRLRVEHDQVVGVGPAVVTRVAHEPLADRRSALPAAVERDVDAAASRIACAWDIDVAVVRHADRMRFREFILIESEQPPGFLS